MPGDLPFFPFQKTIQGRNGVQACSAYLVAGSTTPPINEIRNEIWDRFEGYCRSEAAIVDFVLKLLGGLIPTYTENQGGLLLPLPFS